MKSECVHKLEELRRLAERAYSAHIALHSVVYECGFSANDYEWLSVLLGDTIYQLKDDLKGLNEKLLQIMEGKCNE